MSVTPVYAAIAALLFVFLGYRVTRLRWAERIALGDGGNRVLLRAIRVHGNFAEYVPLALLLMAFAELQGVPAWGMHLIGLTLLGGRVCHAVGLGREPQVLRLRVTGMMLTYAAIAASATAIILAALVPLFAA